MFDIDVNFHVAWIDGATLTLRPLIALQSGHCMCLPLFLQLSVRVAGPDGLAALVVN